MCLTMAKKVIVVIIITVVFFFSLIFTIPIAILSDKFSDYGIIDETIQIVGKSNYEKHEVFI